MAYVIAEPCVDVMDQACVDVCPVDCIHFEEGKDRMLYIEPDECIDCGACEPECPVEAIFTEEDVPDEWKPYTEINVLWFNDKDGGPCQNQRDTARINCGYSDQSGGRERLVATAALSPMSWIVRLLSDD